MEEKLESEIRGNSAQNWGKVAPDFDFRFGRGIEATGKKTMETDRQQLVAASELSSDVSGASRKNVGHVDTFTSFTSHYVEAQS